MSSVLGRVLTAGVLSLGIFGASQYLAERIRPKIEIKETQKPIAVIEDTHEGVEKKPSTSLVWKMVLQGENLHPGEAIKTLESGEARIQFKNSSKYINLDPESTIILTQENGNEISLELMDGSALVGQKEESKSNEPALTLKSAEGKVDISQATVQLSKSGTSTDIQIIKGNARAENSKPLSRIQILSPSLISPVDLQSQPKEEISFQWKGFPENSKVSLYLGKNRKFLKHQGQAEKDRLDLKIPTGNYFWRLVAKEQESQKVLQQSPTFRLKVINSKKMETPVLAEAPQIIAVPPAVNITWLGDPKSSLQNYAHAPKASFAWSTDQSEQVKSWRFKLAEKEEDLKTSKTLIEKDLPEKELKIETAVPRPGRYIAQVEALDATNRVLAISPLKPIEIAPLPLLKAPMFLPEDANFSADFEGRVDLKWTAVQGAKEYLVTLMDSNGVEVRKDKYKGLSSAYLNLLPGEYKISIQAIDAHGRVSDKLPPRSILVPDDSGLQAPKFKKIQVN